MNIQESARSYLFSQIQSVPFEQAAHAIEYRFANPSSHWLLPLYACQAFDGDQAQAVPAMSALIAIQTAILLIDDLLDNDGRRETLGLSVGESANLSTVFQAIGIECITQNLPAPDRQMQVVNQINQMIVETAYGQYLDNQNPISEESYWQATCAKSGPFFGLAFYLGAVAGGATMDKAKAIQKLGRLYGEMIQIHDDLSDSLSVSAGSDWIQKRTTLPILFAKIVDHPEQLKFKALSENIANPGAIKEAQEILLRCGAVSFCLDQIAQRHETGKLLLADMKLPNAQPLIQIFAEIIEPIWGLLGKQGEVLVGSQC
jgi:geranylgeranyl pyrophosphate synthase